MLVIFEQIKLLKQKCQISDFSSYENQKYQQRNLKLISYRLIK